METLTIVEALEKTGFATGSVVQMFEAAAGLAARGHKVVVVTRPSSEMAARCAAAGIEHASLALRHEFDLPSIVRFARLAREHKVDLVHVHKGIAHAVAWGATFLGARYGLVVNRGVSFPIDAWSALKYRSRRVGRIVTVAESIRQVVIATGRIRPEKVSVVYAGVDVARFDPARTDPNAVRNELGIPPEARVVGHVGMRDWKGWKELVRAFPAIRADHPDAHLLLVACTSPAQREGVLELARDMGLAGAVTATLARTDMPDVLAACHVVVDPSWAGTGITGTIREAMALGRPVVVTAVAGNPELVEDGSSGIVVPPRDVAMLAAAVSRLLRDPELAAQLAAAGQERVRAHFSTAARVARLEALYLRVVHDRRTGAR
ncbi:MAG: glycosyltransferase family 4 protein [Thermoanaerobaculaceae bacterium]|nr:glycosyltransferase family 4 protein [Thermoanaerobaculaceae bacterium]TAM50701.1 MAG: glycosyltransferase family 1 protein [Acidobacteriota bacterium]